MTEPIVAYPVRDVLSRIESKLDKNTEAIHQLELAAASAGAVQAALARARAAMWAALGSAASVGGVIIYLLTSHH
jgi:hypothetical protein